MSKMFKSHWKQETKGQFDEYITHDEARPQLLVWNEANMVELFRKKNTPAMKRLTEGLGYWVENKQSHPFTGFIDSYQLITTNYLCCPFIPPKASNSGW
jgi:hypothetical protein